MDYRSYIESDANIVLGKAVIKATRITAAHVLKLLSEGASSEDITSAYPKISHAAINAVLAYAAYVV